jgi:hypothetical protein
MKEVYRRHHSTAAEAVANPSSNLPRQVRPVEQRAHGVASRSLNFSRVHRRSQNVVGRPCDNQARRSVLPRVDRDKFLRRVANEELSGNSSARRPRNFQLNKGSAVEVRRVDFVSRSRLRLVEQLPKRRAPSEKECRALTPSRPRRSEVARLQEPSMASHKVKDSLKAERGSPKKERRRPGRGEDGGRRSGIAAVACAVSAHQGVAPHWKFR